ncbi:glutamine amidotransferase [Parvularcula oceani]|uniref:glutamine amidotransferase n=1 Tax=Parvularcula oceani TaxID=1247963 RepID=UPI0004E1CF66|nr:glutamine amidotransferase [Parvularcula oceani]
MSVALNPLLPWPVLIVLGVIVLAGAALRLRASVPGALLRLLAGLIVLAFLTGPERREAETEPLSDIVLVLTDQSRSAELGGRDAIIASAEERLLADLESRGVEVRQGTVEGRTETDLSEAMTAALSGVPRARLSAIFVITDGQLTDVPGGASLGLSIPVHAYLAGDPEDQRDRRVQILRAPRYGVVGEEAEITFTVLDEGAGAPVPVTLSLGGEVRARREVVPGREVTLNVPLDAPGESVIDISAEVAPGELTAMNNRAAVTLTAIRDRLRVLLVSGEPHPGERTWRNILKSDPAVDLVHFTILKPMDKDARAFPSDLNLIPFPHEELFLEKLSDFDVLIFDRYTYRYVLQAYEFDQIARYVEGGGAVLIASGPEFAGAGSLAARRSLAYVLPVLPTGDAVEEPFVPMLTAAGRRHPVTAGLGEPGDWGRWLRLMPGEVVSGDTVLAGPGDRPLLVLDRIGEGRIAVLMSDHVWLWARGFDGGGPHRELLRRLVHWLMKEPALEEESLRARLTREGRLIAERRTLGEAVAPLEIEAPDGTLREVEPSRIAPGLFGADLPAGQDGLYRLRTRDGDGEVLFAVAALGEPAPRELSEVRTTPDLLAPLVEATGGLSAILPEAGSRLPSLRSVRPGRDASGRNWAGLVQQNAAEIRSLRAMPLLPAWAWLALAAAALLGAWLAEGGRWPRRAKR